MKRKATMLTVTFIFIMTMVPSPPFRTNINAEEITSIEELMASIGIAKVTNKVRAPDFMLRDLEGNTVQLSDYRTKVVMVNFWTTW